MIYSFFKKILTYIFFGCILIIINREVVKRQLSVFLWEKFGQNNMQKGDYMIKDKNPYGKNLYTTLKNFLDKSAMEDYIYKVLGAIKEYDIYNQSNLELVLKTYLECNGSVQNAAEKIYVHRNTINYKIKKIEKLTKTDMSDLRIREEFDAAFMMQDIINSN